MFTVIGKLFAFLNLVVGVGMCMWAVNVYTNRPSYFNPIPESIDKGNTPETFAQFKADIDALGKAANGAAAAWGDGIKVLEQKETTRTYRQGKLAARLKVARDGDPKTGIGFTELLEDPVTKLIDVDKVGPPVLGPPPPGETAGQPLRGADKLLEFANRDASEIARIAAESKALRLEEKDLQVQVQAVETKYLKQTDIRENLHAEFTFLSAFEVTVYEDRETVFKRKKQLQRQLERFNPPKVRD